MCKKDLFPYLSISQIEEIKYVKGLYSIASEWRPCWNQIFFFTCDTSAGFWNSA